jgi:hypothetical protein
MPYRAPRGPIRLLLDLFSSVWLGVSLLAILFVYSSIGSAGAPRHINIFNPGAWEAVRQWRFFEMTEFEWFHWWPFDLLIALICINLVVATLRRIPLNALTAGVWMIHSGIIILALGSVWYFSTKVEGDAPVIRRRIVAMAPGMTEPVSIPALPGNSVIVGDPQSPDAYLLQVADIDPQWELLSGDEKGKKAYKVSVRVQSRLGTFTRDLIADRPQYTQDIIRNPDAKPGSPPMVRAINVLGKPLVDEALQLSLEYDPQQHFYLMDSRAIYLREVGQKEWVQRPIPHSLPRYNDYIATARDVWTEESEPLSPHPILVPVAAVEPNDPLPSVTFQVNRYLRYARMDSRRRGAADGPLDPAATVVLRSSRGETSQHQLHAFDRQANSALRGNLLFTWVESPQALEKLKTRIDPVLRFSVPDTDIIVDEAITHTTSADPALPFKKIEGTDYSYRVESLQALSDIGVSLAIVEIQSPARTFKRWIFDDPAKNRDMAMTDDAAQHGAEVPLDTNLHSVYKPGSLPPAPIMVIAGPSEQDLAIMITQAVGQPQLTPVKIGESIELAAGVTVAVTQYAARTITETKPYVVPRAQRDRDMREFMSMIHVDIPTAGGGSSTWLPFQHYAFAARDEALRRFPYQPQMLTLPDGRTIEMMFSRQRMELPAPVVLDDFKVAAHIGGFTGQTSSIMDWTSVIRFRDRANALTDSKIVSVNKPAVFEGISFFQAQWDPPDRSRFEGDVPSRGLNYTVLGVGNRNGVNAQLAGCIIAVLGMIYNFYYKPVIKRRRQQKVYAEIAAAHAHKNEEAREIEPVGAAWKVQP